MCGDPIVYEACGKEVVGMQSIPVLCGLSAMNLNWESKANFCFGLIFAPEQLKDINYYILVCMEHTNKTRVLRASIVRFFKTWFKHTLQRYGS